MPPAPSLADTMRSTLSAPVSAHYMMRLYVTGTAPNSARAIANIRKLCEQHLQGRYDLQILDIAEHPELALGEQIVAAPTLVRLYPLPVRRFVGDMSWTDRILRGLDIRPSPTMPA